MTGHARSAKTQTLHDEPYAIDAKNLVLLEVEVASAETIATNTTEGGATADRVGETTADTKTIEVGNGNSAAPSKITIGHVRSVTTRISPLETYVTDAKNLALAVEEAGDWRRMYDEKAAECELLESRNRRLHERIEAAEKKLKKKEFSKRDLYFLQRYRSTPRLSTPPAWTTSPRTSSMP